jgi:hypothetical protein
LPCGSISSQKMNKENQINDIYVSLIALLLKRCFLKY